MWRGRLCSFCSRYRFGRRPRLSVLPSLELARPASTVSLFARCIRRLTAHTPVVFGHRDFITDYRGLLGKQMARDLVFANVTPDVLAKPFSTVDDRFRSAPQGMTADIMEVLSYEPRFSSSGNRVCQTVSLIFLAFAYIVTSYFVSLLQSCTYRLPLYRLTFPRTEPSMC